MVRMPDRPTCSATIHTVKVPANCTMIALGASVIRRVSAIQSLANRNPAIRLPANPSRCVGANSLHRNAPLRWRRRRRGRSTARWRRSAGFRPREFSSSRYGSLTWRRIAVAAAASGRRHDGAERDRGGPWHARNQPVREHRDRCGGEADRDEHQRRDRKPVVTKIAQRGVVRGIEQHRGDEQRQRQIRLQRPRRAARQERQRLPPIARKVG